MLLLAVLLACAPTPETGGDTAVGPSVNGRWDEVDGMRVLRLWGTRDEMGYAEGALACTEMVDLFQTYVLDYMVAASGYSYDLALTRSSSRSNCS